MSPADLQKLEDVMGIRLPEEYKQTMSPFPVPHLAGNTDTDLWDDAAALIERNLELRTRTIQPWPACWLFIGDPLSGSANAIDLRNTLVTVSWVDHCDLRSVDTVIGEPFDSWLSQWLAAIRTDLTSDGVDPDGHPRPALNDRRASIGKVAQVLFAIFVVGSIMLGSFFLIRDLARSLLRAD